MKKCKIRYFLPLVCVGLIISVCKGDRAFIPVYSDQGYVYESDNNGLKVIIKKPTASEEAVLLSKDMRILARHDIVPLYVFVTNESDSSQNFSLEDLNLPIVDLKTVSSVINKKLIPSGVALSLEAIPFGLNVGAMIRVAGESTKAAALAFQCGIMIAIFLAVPIAITLGVFIKRMVDAYKTKNDFRALLCPKIMNIAPGETYCGITFVKKFDSSFL